MISVYEDQRIGIFTMEKMEAMICICFVGVRHNCFLDDTKTFIILPSLLIREFY